MHRKQNSPLKQSTLLGKAIEHIFETVCSILSLVLGYFYICLGVLDRSATQLILF